MHYIVVHSSLCFHWQRVCGRASIAAKAWMPGKQRLLAPKYRFRRIGRDMLPATSRP